MDHNKNSRPNDKENDKFKLLNIINKTMFYSFEVIKRDHQLNKICNFFT